MFDKFWDFLVRWRTALLGALFALSAALPAVLNSPEVLAIIPDHYRPYAVAVAFILMYATRPRPATRAADPEVKVAKAIAETPGDTTVVVSQTNGPTTAVVRA